MAGREKKKVRKPTIRPFSLRETLGSQDIIPIQLPDEDNPALNYPQNHLLGLPFELREHIFQYALPDTDTRSRLKAAHIDTWLNPAENLLLVCRQLYHELSDTPVATNRCVLITPPPLDGNASALPLGTSRLAKADKETLAHMGVRELLVRDFLEHLPSGNISREKMNSPRLPSELGMSVSRVVLSVCICRLQRMSQIDSVIQGSRMWRDKFCASAWSCAHALGWDTEEEVESRSWKKRLVVIYHCGHPQKPPSLGENDAMNLRVRTRDTLDWPEIPRRSATKPYREVEISEDGKFTLIPTVESDDSSMLSLDITAPSSSSGSTLGGGLEPRSQPSYALREHFKPEQWLTERLPVDFDERFPYDEEKRSKRRPGWDNPVWRMDDECGPFARYRLRWLDETDGTHKHKNAGMVVEVRDSVTECGMRCVLEG
jgi:hypothetical protein